MVSISISPEAFAAWAEKISLPEKLRRPLQLVMCDRRTPTWAARECGIAPSTVTRAMDKYQFGVCPCCGMKTSSHNLREEEWYRRTSNWFSIADATGISIGDTVAIERSGKVTNNEVVWMETDPDKPGATIVFFVPIGSS